MQITHKAEMWEWLFASDGTCKICGKLIVADCSYARLKRIKYCSPECRKIAQRIKQRVRKYPNYS